MPIPQVYYLNAPSLGSATAIFYDAALTVCADDGYYSDGVITREQVGCVLLPQETCPYCGAVCSPLGEIPTRIELGLYRISVDTGATPTDVGAIIIEFNPNSIPNGIVAIFNSTSYNELSSEFFGYLASTVTGDPTYVGVTADNCGVVGSGSPISLPVSTYDGASFVSTGDSQTVSTDPGSSLLTATAPGKCIMVIPKLTTASNTLTVDIITPCDPDDESTVRISCPSLLRSFTGSVAEDDDPTRCLLLTDQIYYVAPVNGTNPYLGLYDWIFTDAYGENKLADGYYKTNFLYLPNDTIHVQDGVITEILQRC